MPIFRPAVYQHIFIELDNSIFTRHLFEVNPEPKESLFEITFKNEPQFRLTIHKLKTPISGKKYRTVEAPGDYELGPQSYDFENLSQVRGRISQWISRLQEDFKSGVPEYDELEEFRKSVTEYLDSNKSEGNGYFSIDERAELEEKLDSMQKAIDILYEEKQATHQQINRMHSQIIKLKEGVEILDKRTWLSAAVNRVVDIYKEVKAAKNEVSALFHDFEQMLPNPDSPGNEAE